MNYSREQIEAYLIAVQGWDKEQLDYKSTLELLEFVDDFKDIEEWYKEKK